MKTKFFAWATALLLTLTINTAQAQYFCFFVDNQSQVTFTELKIRPSNSGQAFSRDLLPEDLIDPGRHFYVKTGDDSSELYDVQIIKDDGTPLTFSWKGTNGVTYTNKPYLTLNVKDLHTVVLYSSGSGLTFGVYNNDKYGYGDPCE
jgi:hypothetical protein